MKTNVKKITERYLVDVEFRYFKKPTSEFMCEHCTRRHVIGLYDDINEAINEGNKVINELSQFFNFSFGDKLGSYNCGIFKNSVSNLLTNEKTKVIVEIKRYNFGDLADSAKEVIKSTNNYLKSND